VVRTVHHVDDFTSPSLIDCQRRAIRVLASLPGLGLRLDDDVVLVGEYLTSGRHALLVPVDDASALATARRFTWARSAAEHQAIYASLARR